MCRISSALGLAGVDIDRWLDGSVGDPAVRCSSHRTAVVVVVQLGSEIVGRTRDLRLESGHVDLGLTCCWL